MDVIYLKTMEQHNEASYIYLGSRKIPFIHCINLKESRDPGTESSDYPDTL